MRKRLILITCLGLWHNAYSQSSLSIEQYYYKSRLTPFNFVPIVGYQAENKWYFEGRYNYEDKNTGSIYAGKTYNGTGPLTYAITPMIGLVAGCFNGGSLGTNAEIEYKIIAFSTQAQYTFSVRDGTRNYLYSWSDLTIKAFEWFAVGVSLQQTNIYQTQGTFEKGIIIIPKYNKWTFPLYIFNPNSSARYFVFGLNYEMEFKSGQPK